MKINRISDRKTQGSLTVEAALVLPVFIYAVIAFVYFLQIIGLQENLQNAITETGYFAAKYAYVYDYLLNYKDTEPDNKEESTISEGEYEQQEGIDTSIDTIIARTIDSAFYKVKMQDYLDTKSINQSCIKDGFLGIHTYMSSYMAEADSVDLILIYNVKLPLLFIKLDTIQMVQRVRLRGWSGHKVSLKNTPTETNEGNEDTVYITENGTVYHLTKNCTHLALSIKEALFEQIEGLRNDSGGKYKKCELCGDKGNMADQNSVYITNTGDRYHWDLDCSGLKRTIIAILLSEVGDRSLCKRCGK